MSRINVLVAAAESDVKDIKADALVTSVRARDDMLLVGDRVLLTHEIQEQLGCIPSTSGCVLILVGPETNLPGWVQQTLSARENLVVLQVDRIGEEVRLSVRNPRTDSLLAAAKDLCDHVGLKVQYEEHGNSHAFGGRKLLCAAINWIHAVMRSSVLRAMEANGDCAGFSVNGESLVRMLDAASTPTGALHKADEALASALVAETIGAEPLQAAFRAFEFQLLEFRLMLLALAPELDVCYQRCIGYLQDDMSRRVGSLTLYCGLLGDAPTIRSELARHGDRWRQFACDSHTTSADEALRFDPHLAQWLLGDRQALQEDPKLRQALRSQPWAGASILGQTSQYATAIQLMNDILKAEADEAGESASRQGGHWTMLTGVHPDRWRALLEIGAEHFHAHLVRVDPAHLLNVSPADIEQVAERLKRLTYLASATLVIDLATLEESHVEAFAKLLIPRLITVQCPVAVICRQAASVIRSLADVRTSVRSLAPVSMADRIEALGAAAEQANARLMFDEAKALATRYPLSLDQLSQATQLAVGSNDDQQGPLARFTQACRELANQGLSHLADRLEPTFRLEDVVLPADRKRQLNEIVEHVQFAEQVLDRWKFRDQLPFGRGVTVLFFGHSGTGKTIAAMGIANALQSQLLRVDLSRVVSKYIGDTEKNIDRIFNDAQESGSAILFDEAESLLGKRSEVKDAHDRYANIEVAYILQRMEMHEGLVILTTNLRQNIDAAFLRRLRFIVEFPRPDASAREQIWRFCLPADAHALSDNDFRQLARRIDLTGGHIRQITLRAAFIAVATGSRIGLAHLVEATRSELAKLGLPPVDIDLNIDRSAA